MFETLREPADLGEWLAQPPLAAVMTVPVTARELAGPLSGRIRECASDDCPLVFVDSSRPGARRWRAMERCGNRDKLRALRTRRTTNP